MASIQTFRFSNESSSLRYTAFTVMTIVLIVNDWGGVPSALKGNVLSTQVWASEHIQNIVLPHTGRDECLLGALQDATVFHMLRARGVRTVMLGPTPGWRTAAEASYERSTRVPNPYESLAAHGVDECSLFNMDDVHQRPGSAFEYDNDVCEHARRVIVAAASHAQPCFVWLNLLSCFDVERMLPQGSQLSTNVDTCIVISDVAKPYNRRSLPTSITSYIEGISQTTQMSVNRLEHEYATLLQIGWEILRRHNVLVSSLITGALEHGAIVARTTTHSFAIGEHCVRGGNVPLATCCESFWASNVDTGTSRRIEDRIRQMLSKAYTLSIPQGLVSTLLTTRHATFVRAIVPWNEHVYACVIVDGSLRFVFDVGIDPEELANILDEIPHISDELRACATGSLTTHEASAPAVGPMQRTNSPTAPSPPSAHVASTTPSDPASSVQDDVLAPRAVAAPTPSRPSSTPRAAPSRSPSRTHVNVRQIEKQLNLRHR